MLPVGTQGFHPAKTRPMCTMLTSAFTCCCSRHTTACVTCQKQRHQHELPVSTAQQSSHHPAEQLSCVQRDVVPAQPKGHVTYGSASYAAKFMVSPKRCNHHQPFTYPAPSVLTLAGLGPWSRGACGLGLLATFCELPWLPASVSCSVDTHRQHEPHNAQDVDSASMACAMQGFGQPQQCTFFRQPHGTAHVKDNNAARKGHE